ncbi:MAG: 1-acyl-sn-glycerol-3-phosphate acyltransferase [Betaproteobacteria bacterium]|nr:1-acyl-sn-glycerol-3-phosphate acyltransferase [Betaproteobacteria bacterium]
MSDKQTVMASKRFETHRSVRAFRWVRLLTHVAVGLTMVGIFFPHASPTWHAHLTGWWAKKLLRILNIVLSVRGARPAAQARNLIIAANHVSWVDIFVISAAHPARFVAKSEIRDWPIAGWLSERAGTIFIRRTRRSDTAKINDLMHAALADGASIGLFPEGTTTKGDRLLKFHTSLFEPAVVNSATLAPAAICYLSSDGERNEAVAFIGDLSFAESVGLIIGQKSMIAEITFAPQIEASALTRRELALQAEGAIAAMLGVAAPNMHHRFTSSLDEGAAASG